MKNPILFKKYQITARAPNWLRLIFPVLLGTLIITIVVNTLYFGGRRESLAAQAESTMIRWALSFTSTPTLQPGKVITISVTDDDLMVLEKAPSDQLLDAHIREYAAVLEEVAQTKPNWVVISWLTYAHPITPEYLKPLTDVIDRYELRDKVTLAVNLYASGTISPEFVANYNIVEARDCYYEINSFCTFAPEWTWMPQQVMNRFFGHKPNWVISKNLPHTLPNILLNLPTPESIRRHSFLDFRPPGRAELREDSVVFIGNNSQQPLSFRDNKDALQKTYVASSKNHRTLLKDGIPWHTFWASLSSMFIEQRMIAVAPAWVTMLVITIMIVTILAAIKILGGMALAPFLIGTLMLPFINMIGVKFFNLYVPVMDLIIAGFVVFTAATFMSVAISNYRKMMLSAAEDMAIATADIKENFIHLISHNLNTPIAQLRGLLDMLTAPSMHDPSLIAASQKLEYVRVISQCVLGTSTLAGITPQRKEHSVRVFVQEFLENDLEFFRRTETEVSLSPSFDDDEKGEIWFYKFTFDHDVASKIISYACTLVALRDRAKKIYINFSPLNDEPADPRGLMIEISPLETDSSAHLEDAAFCVMALNRFLALAEEMNLVSIRKSTNNVILIFHEPSLNEPR